MTNLECGAQEQPLDIYNRQGIFCVPGDGDNDDRKETGGHDGHSKLVKPRDTRASKFSGLRGRPGKRAPPWATHSAVTVSGRHRRRQRAHAVNRSPCVVARQGRGH